MTTSRPSLSGVYARLILTMLFWGGTFIAGRQLAQSMPPFLAATGRFLAACIPLFWYLKRVEGAWPRLTKRQMAVTFALGATGVFAYNAFFLAGLKLIPASRAALIVALNPVVTSLAMWILLGERLAPLGFLGIGISLSGVALVITRGDFASAWGNAIGTGELCLFGAVLSWVAYTILGRSALKGMSSVAATAYGSLAGLVLLAGAAIIEAATGPVVRPGWGAIAAMAYLGLFGTAIGFVWFYEGIRALGPARASIFSNLVPLFAVTLAAVLLRETIHPTMPLGAGLVILGVMLTNRRPGQSVPDRAIVAEKQI